MMIVIPRLDRGEVVQGCTVYGPEDGIQGMFIEPKKLDPAIKSRDDGGLFGNLQLSLVV